MNTRSAGAEVFEFLRKNVLLAGSYSPIVSVPSPFQSPAIGFHPAPAGPYANTRSAGADEFAFLKKNVLVAGSKRNRFA